MGLAVAGEAAADMTTPRHPRRRERTPALRLDSAELRAIHDALELLIADYSSQPQRHYSAAAVRRTLAKVEAQLAQRAEKRMSRDND